MPSQWERFKQSNIAKIVIGYSLVVWVLIQLIEAVLPTFETPLWVAQTLTFLLILGFPIALLVGWAYEKLPAQSTDTDGAPSVPQPAHSTPRKTLVLIGIGSCAVIGLFGFYMMPFIFDESGFETSSSISDTGTELPIGPVQKPLRTTLNLGETFPRSVGLRGDVAISPDGNTFVYSEYGIPTQRIMVRELDSFSEPRELVSLVFGPGSGFPSFSSDGNWIYYFEAGVLRRVRIEGGASQTIATSPLIGGVTDIDNDNVIYSGADTGKLMVASVSTGEKKPITGEDNSSLYRFPSVIQGTRKLLASRTDSNGIRGASTELVDIDSGETQPIIPIGYNARYADSGHIIFVRGDALWAIPFDITEMKTNGQAVPVVLDIETVSAQAPYTGVAAYAFSDSGRLVYLSGNLSSLESSGRTPVWVDSVGNSVPVGAPKGDYGEAVISPNGLQIAMSVLQAGESDIWVWDTVAGTLGRRTFQGRAAKPIWSPDGSRLLYQNEGNAIWSVAADGTDVPGPFLIAPVSPWPETMSPSGETLVYSGGGGIRDLYTVSEGAEQIQQPLQVSAADARSSAISHDGNWIAYASNETGDYEVYVRPFPNVSDGKWQISREGGGQPIWSKSSNEIYYWAPSNKKYVVEYSVGQGNGDDRPTFFSVGAAKELFTGPYRRSRFPAWDYSSVEKKFLLMEDGASDVEDLITEVNIVDNWFPELTRLSRASSSN